MSAAIRQITLCLPYTSIMGVKDTGVVDMTYRIIADHINTVTAVITYFPVPDSDSQGDALRRILRRAVSYAHQFLGARSCVFWQRVDSAVN